MLSQGQQQQGSCSSAAGAKCSNGAVRKNIRVELAVNINNQTDLKKIDEALKSKGVSMVSSDLEEKLIQLELPRDLGEGDTCRPLENAQSLQRFIEEQTGLLTVVKGLGELNSAVAELRPPPVAKTGPRSKIFGLVRLSQIDDSYCYVDGSVESIEELMTDKNHFSLAIHEYGDLGGDSFENIGEPEININESKTSPDKVGRNSSDTKFHLINKTIQNCDVASLIGKSVALTRRINANTSGEGYKGEVISAGVIARASTIGANKKQLCSCSGKTLWEERLDQKQAK